jgi:Uma2 family endonuclease
MAQLVQTCERYTWDDYRSWPDDERWELIGGEAYAMSPSPGARHQRVSLALGAKLHALLSGKRCEAFIAPMDVHLSGADVVQPDVLVVCDPRKITETHIEGAPDLVVEVASRSSVRHDRLVKLKLYARYGVKEYWLVTPYPHLVEVLVLDGLTYRVHDVSGKADMLTSPTLPGLEIALESIFDFPIPESERIEEVREGTPPYARRAPGEPLSACQQASPSGRAGDR